MRAQAEGAATAQDALEREVASLRLQLEDARREVAHGQRTLDELAKATGSSNEAVAMAQAQVAEELAAAHRRGSRAEDAAMHARDALLEAKARHAAEVGILRKELQAQIDGLAMQLTQITHQYETSVHPELAKKIEKEMANVEARAARADQRRQEAVAEMKTMAGELERLQADFAQQMKTAHAGLESELAAWGRETGQGLRSLW